MNDHAKHRNRPPDKRLADRTKIAEWMLTQPTRSARDVARELNVDHSTVVRDRAAVRAEWQQQRLADVDAAAAEELAHLQHIRSAAYLAWERSLAERRTERVAELRHEKHTTAQVEVVGGADDGKRIDVPQVQPVEVRTASEVSVTRGSGDARHLQIALAATRERISLLGLTPPARVELGVDSSVLDAVLEALADHPAARLAVAAALWTDEGDAGSGGSGGPELEP